MQNAIDKLVNVQISIQTPASTGDTFDVILVVGNAPAAEDAAPPDVGAYSSIQDVSAAGWKPGEAVYDALLAAFGQESVPRSIIVAVRKDEEEISATLDRAAGNFSFYGIFLAFAAEEQDIKAASAWAEASEKMLACTVAAETAPVEAARMIVMYRGEKEDYSALAWMVNCFHYSPGAETWAYKTLSGIKPAELTSTKKEALEKANINYYMTVGGRDITYPGRTSGGEWIDVIRFRDWLVSRIREEVFSLFVTNPKIPFTDAGIALVENRIRYVLSLGQEAGGISESVFTDEGEQPGFTVSVPLASSIQAADRAERRLSGITFQAHLAGAIHLIEIHGNILI